MFGHQRGVLLFSLLVCSALMGSTMCSSQSLVAASEPMPTRPAAPLNARSIINSLSAIGFKFSSDGRIIVPSSSHGKITALPSARSATRTVGIVVSSLFIIIVAYWASYTTTARLPAPPSVTTRKTMNLTEGVSRKRQRKLSRAARMFKATTTGAESVDNTRAAAAWWWSWGPKIMQTVRASLSWRPPALTTFVSRTANTLVMKMLKYTYNRKAARDTAFVTGQLLDAREKRRMRKRMVREQRKQKAATRETTTATATTTTAVDNTPTSRPTTPLLPSPTPSFTATHTNGPVARLAQGGKGADGPDVGTATTSGSLDVLGSNTTRSEATPPSDFTLNTKDTADIEVPTQAQQDSTHGEECGSGEEVQAKEGGDEEVVVPNDDVVKEINDNNDSDSHNNHHHHGKNNDISSNNNSLNDNSSNNNSNHNDGDGEEVSNTAGGAIDANNNNNNSSNNDGDIKEVNNTTGDAVTINADMQDSAPAPPAPPVSAANEINTPPTPAAGGDEGLEEGADADKQEAAPVTTISVYRPDPADTDANKYAVWADNEGFNFATLLQIYLRQEKGSGGVVTRGAKDALRRSGCPEHVIDGTPVVTVSPQEASVLFAAPAPEAEAAEGAAAMAVEEAVQALVEVVEEQEAAGAAVVVVEEVVEAPMEVMEEVVDVEMDTAVVAVDGGEEDAAVVVVDDDTRVAVEIVLV